MKKKLRKLARFIFDTFGINRSLAFQWQFGDAFKEQAKLIKKSNPVIFDVGAYNGISAVRYIKKFPAASVYSFEPFPASFIKLQAAKVNQSHYINQFALADENGEAKFYVNSLKASNSLLPSSDEGIASNTAMITENVITVPQKKLDDYCTENNISYIDILKIDVQGAELKVLRGAEKMLDEQKIGLIYFETEFTQLYKDQPLFEDISLYLRSKNYSFFALYNYSYNRAGRLLAADAVFVSSDIKY